MAELVITGISPAMSHNYEVLSDARISGSGIIGGATVKLVKGDLEIPGVNVIFDDLPRSFRATFELGNDQCYRVLDWCAENPDKECPNPNCFAPVGHWDLVVTNPGGDAVVLPSGFRVREGLKIKPVGAFGGRINKTVVVGDLAYLGRGSYLVILDVSDPANPVEVGSVDLIGGVLDLDVEGAYAFVCTERAPNYFCIVDVSDPTRPELIVGGITTSGSDRTSAVLVQGNTAYVGMGSSNPGQFDRLFAVDVTDPPSIDPDDSGVLHPIATAVGGAAVAGNFLYVHTCAEGVDNTQLRIFDLSGDPLNPVERRPALIDQSHDQITQVAVEGSLVYVALESAPPPTARYHLVIIDVSNPDVPFILARHEEFSGILGPGKDWDGLEVAGGIAYVMVNAGFTLLDVSDPFSSPEVLSELLTPGKAARATVAGSTLYLPDAAAGLNVLDAADPTDPVLVANYASPANMRRMVKRGDLLYVTDMNVGVTVLDVSAPRRPQVVAQHQTGIGPNPPGFDPWPHGAHGIAERDGLLYVGAYFGGLEVLDVTDPANPFLAGSLEFAPDSYSIALDLFGDLAIVGRADRLSRQSSEIVVLDISDIQNIFEVESFPTGSTTIEPIAIETMPDGLILPGLRSQRCYGGRLSGLTIKHIGDKVYFALATELRVFPEDDLDQWPFCLGDATCWESPTQDPIPGVAVSGDRAYLAGLGLWALDMSSIRDVPIVAGRYRRPRQQQLDAEAEGLYVYATAAADRGCKSSTVNALTIYQVAIPGDADDDDDVDLADFAKSQQCFGGADVSPADADCLVFDFDDDGDVDLDDLGRFATAMTGPL